MIFYIKALQTFIWAILAGMIFYLLYAGVTGCITNWVWLFTALVLFECVVIVWNKGNCPLTGYAAKYTADRRDNFDIYLPLWLARNNKAIFLTLLIVALVLIMVRVAR